MCRLLSFYMYFKVNSFILLRLKKCVILAKNVIISDNECLGTCFSEKIEEIGHFLAEIRVSIKVYKTKFARPDNFSAC